MIEAMPRPRPPHLSPERTPAGKILWYFRRGHGPRIRLRAAFGTPEFQAEYLAALSGSAAPAAAAGAGTLQWLYDRYRETTAWRDLSSATRRQRENIMLHVMASAGTAPFKNVTRATLEAGKDRRRETPAQARNFLDASRMSVGLQSLQTFEYLGKHGWSELLNLLLCMWRNENQIAFRQTAPPLET